ncbi:MAG TPA: YrdB family protein [Ktedonobacteraceae bacterium]|jgi:hypothetical protein|nr:YrdB family protein [Ktedonobacteraceae bacterium]
MTKGLKSINLALAFFLELCVLAALCYWGFQSGPGVLAKIALGIGLPVLAIIVWAVFGAPGSTRRLRGGWYWLLRIVFDGLGVAALYAAGQHLLALIFALLAFLNCLLGYAWKQA